MSQPKWKFFANLGDVNPIDHGGQFIFIDETGVYPPELEILALADTSAEDDVWEVHRFILETCTFEDGILSDNKFHKDTPAWFENNICEVASASGIDPAEIIDDLCGDDIRKLALAYAAIADYNGIANFDEYPITFNNRKEVEKRYEGCY